MDALNQRGSLLLNRMSKSPLLSQYQQCISSHNHTNYLLITVLKTREILSLKAFRGQKLIRIIYISIRRTHASKKYRVKKHSCSCNERRTHNKTVQFMLNGIFRPHKHFRCMHARRGGAKFYETLSTV